MSNNALINVRTHPHNGSDALHAAAQCGFSHILVVSHSSNKQVGFKTFSERHRHYALYFLN